MKSDFVPVFSQYWPSRQKDENVIISAKSYIINQWSKHTEAKRLTRSKIAKKLLYILKPNLSVFNN